MKTLSTVFEVALTVFKRLLRDVICPLLGLYLVYRLARGGFETPAIPFIATLASAMIGIPVWTRSDERGRGHNGNNGAKGRRRKRRVTIDWGGGREEDEDDG